MMDTAVPEIFGNRLGGDVLNGECAAQRRFIQLEAARVVGEEQFAVLGEELAASQE